MVGLKMPYVCTYVKSRIRRCHGEDWRGEALATAPSSLAHCGGPSGTAQGCSAAPPGSPHRASRRARRLISWCLICRECEHEQLAAVGILGERRRHERGVVQRDHVDTPPAHTLPAATPAPLLQWLRERLEPSSQPVERFHAHTSTAAVGGIQRLPRPVRISLLHPPHLSPRASLPRAQLLVPGSLRLARVAAEALAADQSAVGESRCVEEAGVGAHPPRALW